MAGIFLGVLLCPSSFSSAGHGAQSDGFILRFHSKLIFLANLYLETRRSHIISSLSPLPPFSQHPLLLPSTMNQTFHHPQQLIESSWRTLENVRISFSLLTRRSCVLTRDISQATSPSLREILAAFKYSKGQEGDCQLLLAVLNAKSAEDQVICLRIMDSASLTRSPRLAANRRDRQSARASFGIPSGQALCYTFPSSDVFHSRTPHSVTHLTTSITFAVFTIRAIQ